MFLMLNTNFDVDIFDLKMIIDYRNDNLPVINPIIIMYIKNLVFYS